MAKVSMKCVSRGWSSAFRSCRYARLGGLCSSLVIVATLLLLGSHFASADTIVTNREVAQLVRLEEVDELDGEIFGYVANHSDRYIYRVTLLIRYHWHWHNETRPGEDDPSRHDELTLTELIQPEGRVRFSYHPTSPLPERSDGDLLPTVSISSVQAYEKRAAPAAKPNPESAPVRPKVAPSVPLNEAPPSGGNVPIEPAPAVESAPVRELTLPAETAPAEEGSSTQP